ncbi:MAG: site-specific integrase, partial [Clostridia bacterium]|nr:site-specific integrase [Clostridia bacterium]
WDTVDFENGTVRIVQQLQLHKGTYQLMPTKNGKPRTLTPAPYVMNLLRTQKRIQAGWRLAAGSAWQDDGFVFCNPIGEHLARQTVYKHYKNAVESIGLKDRRFHDLRHTYAVASLRAGDDPKTVSENLGHATVAFTLDIYGHVTEQMRRASADRMQAYIDALTL